MRKILYTSVVLTDESRIRLIQCMKSKNPFIHSIRYAHHMTIAFYRNEVSEELDNWARENDGKSIALTATEYGNSDKAIAVMVETSAPSANVIKHVTLWTNADNNGKPVDSNNIENWTKLNEEIRLDGVVTIVYADK